METLTGFDFIGASDQKVNLVNASGMEKRVGADTVVVSVGFKPDTELYKTLRGSTPENCILLETPVLSGT